MGKKKDPFEKLESGALGLVSSGLVSGIGADVIGKVDTTGAASEAITGLGTLSSFSPVLGSIYGASATLDALEEIKKKGKR